MNEYNRNVVNMISEKMYLEGKHRSLIKILPDSLDLLKLRNARINPIDTSQKYIYYEYDRLNPIANIYIDSLNEINYKITKNTLQIDLIRGYSKILNKNIKAKKCYVIAVGLISTICLIICLRKWYLLKDKIDDER